MILPQNTMKEYTRWTHLYIQEYLTFFIHDIHTGSITKKECRDMSHGKIMHILFDQQAVCGRIVKGKKAYLCSEGNIAICLYHSSTGLETTSLLF